jgi:malonyl CoA-acyl carrier protein transacylase/acyl carrier protein
MSSGTSINQSKINIEQKKQKKRINKKRTPRFMMKKILNSRLPLMVYNPPLAFDMNYFVNIFMAGALPIFETAFYTDKQIIDILKKLSKADLLFGMRLPIHKQGVIQYLQQHYHANLDIIVFTYNDTADLQSFSFDNTDYRYFVEVVDIDINDALNALAPQGIIVRGFEAPGKVSKYTSMVIMQWYLENSDFPVFVHGGVGWYTAAGMFAAGASGVVLDDQLYLTDEAPVDESFKQLIRSIKENDSMVIGQTVGVQYRFFAKLGTKIVKDMAQKESFMAEEANAPQILYHEIEANISPINQPHSAPMQSLFYLGQDAVFAQRFTEASTRLQEIIPAFFENISGMLKAIDAHDPMREHSTLAREHGTTYPIMQGPMANISDNADFAAKVYESGGLPFFAMGSLPKPLAEKMLREGAAKVPRFGAGMIGIETFNKTIQEHFDLVKQYKAPFALFAGGIPAQVKELEAAGVKAYLHTPSMMMLENAIEHNCTRFIFEGTEAGGHVGTLTSLSLWEMGIERLMRQTDEQLSRQAIIFAGGMATRCASWFISGISAMLAKRGARVGIQVGTSYLFTKEIVETGAIKKLYQDIICEKNDTIVIGKTVGLASRTIKSPLSCRMIEDEHRRIKEGLPLGERKTAFEQENLGSLLIGAKACCPDFSRVKDDGTCEMIEFNRDDHYEKGNFLVGDALAFNRDPITIQDVHDSFFNEKKGLAQNLNILEVVSSETHSIQDDIAIVGMGGIYPDADNPEALWQNVVSRKYSIREMPSDRFDAELYYDADRKAEDKSYTKIAGVIQDFVFDREKYGYTQEKASKLSRSQQMILEAACQAVEDAGYLEPDLRLQEAWREKTAVIIGTCLGNEQGNNLHLKYYYPEVQAHLDQIEAYQALDETQQQKVADELRAQMAYGYPGYEPVHGSSLNIEAARIAYHMGIEGVNYVVDAACATSFAAFDCAIKELLSGDYDMALAGGVNTHLAPEPFVGFCKMGALSADGSYPFDERADGFVLGEGAGVVVLKRMKDALRDKDRIYGVIRGIGSSSDGKGKAIAAPNIEGQTHALRRCFENVKSPIRFDDVDYIEAHGTSTIMGDQAELETIKKVYKCQTPVGISSVKSQIGHLLGGSGTAGLIKAVKAIEHRMLPPNGEFEKLASRHAIDDTPFYIITEATPWEKTDERPRMAAVSSFGFGGINYHMVIEEFTPGYQPLPRTIFENPSYDANDDRIVIAGLGVMLPGSKNVDEFWENLKSGEPMYSDRIPDSRFHNDYYAREKEESRGYRIPAVKAGLVNDYRFNNVKYRIPPFAAQSIDRAQLFALEAATQAIEQAGLQPLLEAGNRTAVILGTISGEMSVENVLRVRVDYLKKVLHEMDGIDETARTAMADALAERLRARYHRNTEDTIPGLLSNIVSGRIANHYNCNGANFVVDASCASSTVAIDLAVKGLRSKDYDFVITGGADTNLYPTIMLAFKRLSLLSDDICRLYDKGAKGYVMGEGAAVQVMTTYKNAKKHNMPILAELNNIAFTSSVPRHLLSPSEKAYAGAIDACYGKSSVSRNQIMHLDVFGCCNPLLDQVEKQAIESSFSKATYFGNVKPEFGYFKAANPAVVLTKLALMSHHRQILPNNSYVPETSIVKPDSVLKANDRLLDVSDRHMLCFAANVNGIGGDHGHTIVNSLPEWMAPAVGSTTSDETDATPQSPQESAGASAAAAASKRAASASSYAQSGKVCALLCGQGSQYTDMMRELYDNDAAIRSLLDRGDAIVKETRGYSMLGIMFGDKSEPLNLTENTQPAIFLATAAIFDHLKQKGFAPDFFIGHSIGEYAALYCSGMLDFETTLRLIIKRSDLMKQSTEQVPGRIMVVFGNDETAAALIRESGIGGIYIANKNSEKQTAVAGEEAGIEAFCRFLKEKKVMFKKLALSAAFHTPMLKTASEQLRDYMASLTFNDVDFSKVISNVTAKPYPQDASAVKDLLARQIQSPLEFIASVQYVRKRGADNFIEIGTGKILTNLLKNIPVKPYHALPAVDAKKGENQSLKALVDYLQAQHLLVTPMTGGTVPETMKMNILTQEASVHPDTAGASLMADQYTGDGGEDFESFVRDNEASLKELMYQEYLKHRREKAIEAVEKYDFYMDKIAIAGVAIGLPGTGNKVFNSDNFEKLLGGTNFIERLTEAEKEKILDLNITRVFKDPDGNARFHEIKDTNDVIQLAGKLGYFNLKDEYGIEYDYDITISLAIAAGMEALKDANIPLVMDYRTTSTGRKIPSGFRLPEEMQEKTGVILTSLFQGFDTLINHITRYFYNKFYVRPYDELENIYYHLMTVVTDKTIKDQITDWFFRIKERRQEYGSFNFDRNLLIDVVPLGSAHFAQLIKAKGPNVQMSGACASTTQAVGMAEDWIRTGRCERVIIVGGEASTSEAQNPWIGSGFLAMGAATVKNIVAEAAKPFDTERNGTILGSGAVSLIVEREDSLRERGLNGQAEIMGTHLGNSAYHATQIDVPHLTEEMQRFFKRIEKRHGVKPAEVAQSMLFMSHETFTPARGGSASGEISALRTTFPDDYKKIIISNTKGFTGHTLGAALEDAVMVKALQTGMAPPIANLRNIPEEFRDLTLNKGLKTDGFQYALHLAAGFGSHFSFLFLKRIQENSIQGNARFQKWLKRISGSENPELIEIKNTLCVEDHQSKSDELRSQKVMAVDSIKLKAAAATAPEPAETGPAAAPEAAPAVGDTSSFEATIKTIIAEQTGYTEDMLEPELDLEADLGIDTVKQVEIFGKISDHFGLKVPEDLKLVELNTIAKLVDYIVTQTGGTAAAAEAAPAAESVTGAVSETPASAAPAADKTALLKTVQQIVAEQTGYTEDMLEPELDLEADLGIDTVKQVEIFSKISDHFGLKVPEDLKLTELNTIAKLVDYIADKIGGGGTSPEDGPDGGGPSGGPGGMPSGGPEDGVVSETADAGVQTPAVSPEAAASASHLKVVQQIIAEQTGYTEDMLEPELDLEADLGIDTVKQVEIFSKISDHFGLKVPEDLKLTELNTITKLADYIGREVSGTAAAETTTEAPQPETESAVDLTPPADSAIKRLVVEVQKTETPQGQNTIFENQTVLVSRDSYGFADRLIEAIGQQGGRAVTIGTDDAADFTYMEFTRADEDKLPKEKKLKKVIKQIVKTHGDIHGFIHLSPIDAALSNEPIGEKDINTAVKSFFIIVKKLFDGFNKPGSVISALSFDSVVFPYLEGDRTIRPLFGAMAGMMKTINKEMPDTLVKMVDFSVSDPRADVKAIVDRYLAELMSGDKRVEVGYQDDQRYVPVLKERRAAQGDSLMQSGDTVLVTGGARGITYEILKSLVKAYKINLVILGRSDIEGIDPEFKTDAADAAFILNKLKTRMTDAKPLEIKKAVDRIIKFKESLNNIETLKSMGVQVDYHAVDVTNAQAVEKAIAAHGKIDGVVHAAGLEESQFIPKKELKSFNRVFDTKIYGILNLLQAMQDRDYRFFVTFSSVTARFGNEGQIDYTAANDMLTKMLLKEKQAHPERNYKVYDWTAWEGAGMATNPTVKKVLEQRGLQFLPLELGVQFFISDLTDRQTTEVVISGLDYDFDIDHLMQGGKTAGEEGPAPFLDTLIEKTEDRVSFSRVLDLKRDVFLLDHARLDIPLFLGATGVETMAEAAAQLVDDDLQLVELTDFAIPYGIKILKQRPKEILISSEKVADAENICRSTIDSVFKNPKGVVVGDPKRHYQSTYRFAVQAPEALRIDLPEFKPVQFEGDFKDLIYHPQRLFMNGIFDSVHGFVSFDKDLLITRMSDISGADFFAGEPSPNFITDVVMVDAMFQTGGIFEFMTSNDLVLPFNIRRMTFLKAPQKGQEYLCLTQKTASAEETNTYQLHLVDADGNVFIKVEDFQMVRVTKLEKEYQVLDRFK